MRGVGEEIGVQEHVHVACTDVDSVERIARVPDDLLLQPPVAPREVDNDGVRQIGDAWPEPLDGPLASGWTDVDGLPSVRRTANGIRGWSTGMSVTSGIATPTRATSSTGGDAGMWTTSPSTSSTGTA